MQFNPIDWSAEFWAVVVALLALIRPEITKYFVSRRKAVAVQMRQPMELGFSNFGPIVSFVYSLICFGNKRTFTRFECKIVRVSDKAEVEFSAFFAKSTNPMLNHDELLKQTTYWIPLTVDNDFAGTFSTFFISSIMFDRVQQDMREFKSRWQTYLSTSNDPNSSSYSDEIREIFREFLKMDAAHEFWRRNRDRMLSTWLEGEYKIQFTLIDSRGRQERAGAFSFYVDEQLRKDIEFNITTIQIAAAENIMREPSYRFFSIPLKA